MHVKLLQTSDAFRYFDLLAITSKPTRRFCEINGFDYEAFIGLRMGSASWHATYNRIPLLLGALNEGYRGWIVYMDADAYVANLRYDLAALLAQHGGRSVLGAPGGDQPWNINAGIIFLNLGQTAGQEVVRGWAELFTRYVGNERLKLANEPWTAGLKDDQVLLHEVLAHRTQPEAIHRLPLELVGSPNSHFIRQLLRQYGTLEERAARATLDVETIMRSDRDA